MDYRIILLFITAFANILLFLAIVIRNRKVKSNLWYGLVIFSAAAWSLGLAFFLLSRTPGIARFWAIIYYIAASLIGYGYYNYSRFFPVKTESKGYKYRAEVVSAIPVVLLALILIFSDYHLAEIYINPIGNSAKLGAGYYLYVVYFVTYVFLAFYNWYRKKSLLTNLQRTQLKYVITGTGIALLFGSFFNLFLPIVDYSLVWAGPIFTILMIVTFIVAIVRYRLMNIRLILARSFLYFLLIAVVTTVFAFTTFALSRYIHVETRYGELTIIMVVSFLIVVGIDPLKTFLAKITDDIFYKDKVDYQKLLQKISITIAREIDLEILLNGLTTIIENGLKVKAADILIKDGASYQSDTPHGVKKFEDTSFFIGYLKRYHKTVIVEELYRELTDKPDGQERSFLEGVYDEMTRNGIEFFAPVYLEGQLKAIIILSEKNSGDIYTGQDVEFFDSLAPQIAVAIEKSQLYESIGEFNLKLQEKVNRATQELKETNVRLQEANAHLKQLDRAKSEFLSIASHQLRTPISAIKGYLSMLLEGDFGKVPEQQRAIISDLFESASRLARLINIFLNVSRIESGRFKLDRTEVNVNELVTGVIKELSGQAKQKNLDLKFKAMESPPLMYIDSDKVREVILNLIDNAIKYTPSGSITVETYVEDNKMHFKITDSGVGIRPEEVRSLFRKFVRGTGIAQVNTTGSGLGLYIAQRVISEHGGNIWAESEGLNKGSTFRFVLPVTTKADFNRKQLEKEVAEKEKEQKDS